jgi:GT2 family glycosyltransferase
MKTNPLVYIIVLNWNNPKDTVECIESLKRLKYPNFRILLVDNGSTDESIDIFSKKFADIEIIKNKANFGYVIANNIGIGYALNHGADYVMILNNDIIVEQDMLVNLLVVYGTEKAILSPKVYYYDRPKVINSMGTSINWFRLRPNLGHCGTEDTGQFSGTYEAKVLVGCAILISSEILEQVGYFDEPFYMIHEDADICLRNFNKGNKNLTVSDAVVYHKASATLGKNPAITSYYNIRNFLYLAKKHASFLEKQKVHCGLCVLILKNCLRFMFQKNKRREVRAFFVGVWDYCRGKMYKCQRPL